VFEAALSDLAADLQAGDRRACFLDIVRLPPVQRCTGVGQTKKGQGSQIRAVVEAHGLPVVVPLDSATPHEVKLVEQTQAARLVENTPAPRMGDKAEDSDRPDADLAPAGIERIAPHRKSRKNRTQKR
jgi:hypothetical protein